MTNLRTTSTELLFFKNKSNLWIAWNRCDSLNSYPSREDCERNRERDRAADALQINCRSWVTPPLHFSPSFPPRRTVWHHHCLHPRLLWVWVTHSLCPSSNASNITYSNELAYCHILTLVWHPIWSLESFLWSMKCSDRKVLPSQPWMCIRVYSNMLSSTVNLLFAILSLSLLDSLSNGEYTLALFDY